MKNIKGNPCNIGLRMAGGLIYYFNKNGIYQAIPVADALKSGIDIGMTIDHHPYINTWRFLRLFDIKDDRLLSKAICMLKVGDTIDTLDTYLGTVSITRRPKPDGLDRFILNIEKPIVCRIPENYNKNSFDYIRITVYVISKWDSDRMQFILEHKDELHKRVLNKLSADKDFRKFNIPVNFLKVSKITFSSRLNLLEYILEIKDFS